MTRRTGPTQAVRDAVAAREGYCCACCGDMGGPFHWHHRRARSMGGTRRPETNGLANIVLLSEQCHARIESRRTLALANGWLVPQHADPALVPFLYRGRFVLLTDLGAVEPTEVSA